MAYGTVWLSSSRASLPWFWIATLLAVASTVAYPWLSTSSSRARLARAGFQVGRLAVLLAVVDLPTVVESGFYRYPVVLGLAALLVVLDGLPLVSELGMG